MKTGSKEKKAEESWRGVVVQWEALYLLLFWPKMGDRKVNNNEGSQAVTARPFGEDRLDKR